MSQRPSMNMSLFVVCGRTPYPSTGTAQPLILAPLECGSKTESASADFAAKGVDCVSWWPQSERVTARNRDGNMENEEARDVKRGRRGDKVVLWRCCGGEEGWREESRGDRIQPERASKAEGGRKRRRVRGSSAFTTEGIDVGRLENGIWICQADASVKKVSVQMFHAKTESASADFAAKGVDCVSWWPQSERVTARNRDGNMENEEARDVKRGRRGDKVVLWRCCGGEEGWREESRGDRIQPERASKAEGGRKRRRVRGSSAFTTEGIDVGRLENGIWTARLFNDRDILGPLARDEKEMWGNCTYAASVKIEWRRREAVKVARFFALEIFYLTWFACFSALISPAYACRGGAGLCGKNSFGWKRG
ncbi:hypothetical protein WH47_08629 [Habropoda laboriosa]|uniref:Uncharacterized protein n=1 Tax=Habropoda laboriosa TaxID=597456 RepID=A0A0L7QP59_9HYME|nr:hypothetical protein WH47_08629 [Habropoda laboriosa]